MPPPVVMKLREVFAKNLRVLRQQRGISQEVLAHDAGIDRSYISALERSVSAATVDMIERLAEILQVEPAAFLELPPKKRR